MGGQEDSRVRTVVRGLLWAGGVVLGFVLVVLLMNGRAHAAEYPPPAPGLVSVAAG
jgi:hypothetical protein